ncbi:putative Homoaconitase, mitochondrial [Seiridium unicorne]|uniref:Homoaconitase, mitochondrial n=1 Tax=Seiridium unicorne TaxID=138068 RepID=A0ABR2V589_9PEZI
MGVLNTLALALALLITAVATTYTATSNCFLLRGALTNGTDLGFFNVSDQAFDIHAAFVSDGSLATKLGIDTSTGNMVDYNDGDVDPGFPHKGLIAATEWEGQYYSDYLYFEPPQALQNQETAANVALNCELSPGNILSCSHPHPKRPNYNVFQYCNHWGNDLEIGTPDNPASCAPVVLSATAAIGCTPPTTTPSVGSTTTRTTTTLPTSTVMPHPRFVCLDSSSPICSDGFLLATAPWARSLGRVSSRISSRRILSQRLPRTPALHPSYRRFISATTSDRATHADSHVQATEFPFTNAPVEKKTPQTLTEKIVQSHAVGLPEEKVVRSGDYVQIKPHRCMSHDNTWPIAKKFMSIGATQLKDPKQMVFALDHDVQNKSETNLKKYEQIEAFAKTHGVPFFGAGEGIGHQKMVEDLFVWPGKLCVASDSHSNMYGGISSLGTALVRTDAASIWATGKSWFQVPPVAQVTLTGTLPPGVTGKDVIVALCGLFPTDVLNHAVEFTGSEETMASISVDNRLTISNMSTEWSALSAMFPMDQTLERWLRYKATEAAMFEDRTTKDRITHEKVDELYANPVVADPGAHYAKRLYLNLSSLSPYVSGPNSVKISTPLGDLAPQNIKVNKAYIVSCTNSRASDIAAAAKVFQDAAKANGDKVPKVADGVKLYIAAASAREQEAAEDNGSWQTLLEAGAIPLPASCGPCIGLGTGLLEDGEVGISASNRNFKGRMGSRSALAYLASPEVVAASALHGVIAGTGVYKAPADYAGVEFGYGTGAPATTESELGNVLEQLESLIDRVESSVGDDTSKATTQIVPGFPEKISGEIIFCDADNLDTDNIYPGKFTYQDDITREGMAGVCMSNYDPDFRSIAKPNDILVSGYNFGTGSSREQAATAILAKQIPLVVAGSLGNIYSRNAINNALLALEIPRLVERLRATFNSADKVLTRRTGWTLTWDVARSVVEVKEGENGDRWEVKVGEFAANLQEIIAKGGLPDWIKHEISKTEA